MVTWESRKFDIASKMEQKRDGRFRFNQKPRRKPPRPLWWTLAMLIILMILFMYLRRMM
ncbi:MAG: hypothetical protein WCS36_03450 [Candidatus Neomarinimicrobiota bacterium]|jgi:hypothetical protein|nr:hypothetical protein [Candidatus Neomarinimicrobiota bacterium]